MKQSNAYLIIIVTVIFVGITSIVSLYKDSENRRVEGERFLFPELSVSTDVNSLKLLYVSLPFFKTLIKLIC